jgi:type II secretory pathway component PulL
MINNVLILASLLTFESEDDFYHLQILKRKKEHPELGSNSYVVKTYYISSLKYLGNKMPEIQQLCQFHNARAYINLNVRSYEKLAFQMLKKVTDQIMNRDFRSVRKAYESVSGEYGTGRIRSGS